MKKDFSCNYPDGLYNKSVYLPKQIVDKLPDKINTIIYTDHAREIAKLRNIKLPDRIYGGNVFEVEVRNGMIKKACYRIRSYRNTDLCLVFHTIPGRMVCVTAWINPKSYTHPELKRELYIQGE